MRFSFFIVAFWLFLASQALAIEVKLLPIFIGSDQEKSYLSDFFNLLPSDSAEEILKYVGGVRFLSRGAFSLQQDLSIRSSNFDENKIFLEGIEIDSSQSGHLSLDLPFTEVDLERVTLDKDNNKIDFRLKLPLENRAEAKISGGMYGFSQRLVSLSFPVGSVKSRLSFESASSSACRPDRDFTLYKISLVSFYQDYFSQIKFIFGLSKKDFGADGFYAAPWYNQEEEHTQSLILSISAKLDFPEFKLTITPFLNRHFDKFYLDRNNPSIYTNYHTTYRYGITNKVRLKDYNLALKFKWIEETITSTRLGNHKRQIYKGEIAWGPFFMSKNLNYRFSFSENYYSHWGMREKYEAEANYLIRYKKDKLKLKLARFFTLPSFTSLYYDSPSNKGNIHLSLPRTDNFYLGWVHRGNIECSLGLFYRRIKNRIDWFNKPPASFYQAQNMSIIKAMGIESQLHFLPPWLKPWLDLAVSYDFVNDSHSSEEGTYKYSHIFTKHQIINIATFRLSKGTNLVIVGKYQKTNKHVSFFVVDVKFSKEFNSHLSFFIEGNNIFNKKYQLIEYIDSPPRFWRSGIKVYF